jgi:hypothetical protein
VNNDSRKGHSPVGLYPFLHSLPLWAGFLLFNCELRMRFFKEALRYGLNPGIKRTTADEYLLAVGCYYVFPVDDHQNVDSIVQNQPNCVFVPC